MIDKNVTFITGAPRSATRSLAHYMPEFGFEHSYHELYPVLSKKFSLTLYSAYDPMTLKGNSRPVVNTRKKALKWENFFRKTDSDHLVDVCWMNSYAMVPISQAWPNSRWIIIYRPIDQVANSISAFLSDDNYTWTVEWCADFWTILWTHILGQIPYIKNDILLIRFDKYIQGKENKRIGEFLNRLTPKSLPPHVNKRRIDYEDQPVPEELLQKGKELEQEVMKYYA
jgi:hypothetical protein